MTLKDGSIGVVSVAVAAGWLVLLSQNPVAQTPVEHSSEARFQLDVHAPDAAIASYLPPGFALNVATQGAAKDCNLRVVFIDRVTINTPDGKPAGKTGSNRLVYLIVPVRDPGGTNAQLVIGGLTEDPADAPGPFGVYLPATVHTMQRSTSSTGSTGKGGTSTILDSQDWEFRAATGEHLELHIKYERGVANKANPTETRFYSAKTPGVFQISRDERVLDILRNVTTNPPDRVKEFSFKASGGSYSKLFDGTEKLLSWDNILWINRNVSTP
jgi:hypothetical protein